MDWQAILHDKKLLYVAGIGGAVGLYALYQRKKSSGSTSSSPAAGANPAGTGYAPGTFDSTGTDVAAYLGQFAQAQQAQMDAWTQQLTGALSGLTPPHPTGTPSPVPGPVSGPVWNGPIKLPFAPSPTPPKVTPPAWAPKPGTVTVVPFTKTNPAWDSTLSGIAAHDHTTVSALLKLNPGISNPDIIHPGQQIRVS